MNEKWFKKYGVTNNTTADDWVSKKIPKKKLSSYFNFKIYSNEKIKVESIFLGYFLNGIYSQTYKISKRHGFKAIKKARTGYYKFADID